MTSFRFIETNILVRHITGDNVVQSPQSSQLLNLMAGGAFEGLLSMTVLFEATYVLSSIYRLDRVSIVESLIGVLGLPGISMLNKERDYLDQTLSLYMSIPRLSFADCYHAALSLAHCNGEIYTYDLDFDRVPGLTRLEPGD